MYNIKIQFMMTTQDCLEFEKLFEKLKIINWQFAKIDIILKALIELISIEELMV